MKKYILGINPCIHGLNYHDPSACLLDCSQLLFAIEEERLNGVKHSCGLFPQKAVAQCKRIALENDGIITNIAIGHQPNLWNYRYNAKKPDSSFDPRMTLSLEIQNMCDCSNARVNFYEHHKSHAASAHFCSGFERSLCIVFDGAGELAAASAWMAEGGSILKLDEILMPNSLGYLYAAVTSYLGFIPWNDEGKTMALAPYGERDKKIENIFFEFFDHDFSDYNVEPLIKGSLSNGYLLNIESMDAQLSDIFNHKKRSKEEPLTQFHKNLAYEIQTFTENAVKKYIAKWMNQTKCENVCLSGGLFMNCKLNGFLRDTLPLKKLYVQPVSGDAGTALGAALLCSKHVAPDIDLHGLGLGLCYTDEDILPILRSYNCKYHFSNDVALETASLLAQNHIVEWFQGRSEFGSRALCHRSLLAPPTPIEISDNLNQRIKHREQWRPFACSIMEEFSGDLLHNYSKSCGPEYMIESFHADRKWVKKMEAVIHRVDHSTRPQIIKSNSDNLIMHNLLERYYSMTGYPMVLNTSLNDHGQPIITTPEEAVIFFLNHDVDAMAIGNFIVRK